MSKFLFLTRETKTSIDQDREGKMKFLKKLLKFDNLFNIDIDIYALLSLSLKVTKGIILLLSNN